MKSVIVFACVAIAAASAQWSQFVPTSQQGVQRGGPYEARGWRPAGPSFTLPLRQQQYPQEIVQQQLPRADLPTLFQEYGPPAEEYGPPQKNTTEATPEEVTTESADVTTTELTPTTTEASSEQLKEQEKDDLKEEKQAVAQEGFYYVYHPTGLLQKVVYATKDDLKNMAYTAQIKYQNVEPIRGPIYTYDPQTFVFQQLNV